VSWFLAAPAAPCCAAVSTIWCFASLLEAAQLFDEFIASTRLPFYRKLWCDCNVLAVLMFVTDTHHILWLLRQCLPHDSHE